MADSFSNVLTTRQHRVLAALAGRSWQMDDLRQHCEPDLSSWHWTRITSRLAERGMIRVDARKVSITTTGRAALETLRVVDVQTTRRSSLTQRTEHMPRLDRDLLRAGGYVPPDERERATRRIRERNAARVAQIMRARM